MYQYIPNLITIMRLILIAPFLFCVLTQHYVSAFTLFMIAGASDGLDGFLARRYHWMSPLGSMLDPLADKFLMITSFFLLAYLRKIPIWFCGVVIFRDVIIVSGASGAFAMFKHVQFNPSMLSKINTTLQGLLVACLLFELAFSVLPHELIMALMYVVMFTTVTSLFHYLWLGCAMLYHRRHA